MARLQRALAFLLLAVLLAGAGIAFVRTQILKARPSPIAATDFRSARIFSPVAALPPVATVRVDVPEAGRVDVRILDRAGKRVRTLLRASDQPAGPLAVTWDGLADDGTSAPAGTYRAVVRFRDLPASESVTRRLVLQRRARGTTAQMAVTLRDPGRVEAEIVDESGHAVRTLLPETERPAGRLALAWDGDDDEGARVPDGGYRLRVRLPDQRRTITMPNVIELDGTPPEVEVALPQTATVAPGQPGAAGELRAPMTASEPVRVGLVVTRILPDRSSVLVYRELYPPFSTKRTLVWDGSTGTRRAGKAGPPAPPGTYIVGWEAVDRAGNVVRVPAGDVAPGRVAPAAVVRVPAVVVDPITRTVQAPAPLATLERFAPGAGSLGEPLARAEAPTDEVVLDAPDAPGLYLLRGTAGGRAGYASEPVAGDAETLVMVPLLSWQARNPYDGDGDGFPDVPPLPLAIDRPLGKIALRGTQTLAARLATAGGRLGEVGAISDVTIDREGVPDTARVLVIAGGSVWTPGMAQAIDAFRDRGGVVLQLGEPLDVRGALADGELEVGGDAPFPVAGKRVTSDVDVAVRALRRGAAQGARAA